MTNSSGVITLSNVVAAIKVHGEIHSNRNGNQHSVARHGLLSLADAFGVGW